MKFTLKDYQDDAVEAVLDRLKKARKYWHDDGGRNAFSLTAATGAGKTVMAAAVIESLFFGNDDYEFDADPGAVVIWFSDDPSLNEQSRWRLQEAADKLTVSDLVTVESTFGAAKFEPGKVYFLNTQKLSKNSLLVRGDEPGEAVLETPDGQLIMPDQRAHTIWDTIRNTIEDPDLTLYLVLDEAHRGMRESGRAASDRKQTIVRRLINGSGGTPGIPVVWGISATVQRFNDAITGMEGRGTLPNVIVDARKVQDSGLLKDTINLDIPDEDGAYETVLLRRGTVKLREISKAWADYAREQDASGKVLPLMVLQVPNSPDPLDIGRWIDSIFETWPELSSDCVANVFGEHKTEIFGSHSVPYIAPERVQESDWVRVLIAKDAISTGWDCPRAEVMVSFRAASDKTHITQLLGRMVRTPLARRIPGNGRLNAVDCLLPRFDRASVEAVAKSLETGSEAGDELKRHVLINAATVTSNPEIPEDVWQKWLSLPSYVLPRRQARPVKRLTALAHELAADGLLPDAGKKAHAELHKALDAAGVRFRDEVAKARGSVLSVEGLTLTADVGGAKRTIDSFVEAADHAAIEDAYKRAARLISPDLSRSYSEYLAGQPGSDVDPEDALIEAHTIVAALGLVPEVKTYLDNEADQLASNWLAKYRVDRSRLSDDRQDVYREIQAMSSDPSPVALALPKASLQPTTKRDRDGSIVLLPKFELHLLCDENGLYSSDLNNWEQKIVDGELARSGNVAWYRNPGAVRQDSLAVPYEIGGETKLLHPDFIFFARLDDGGLAVDIVDPHGIQFSDALPKLKGLSRYAEENEGVFRRIDVYAEVGKNARVIDLTDKRVRTAVNAALTIDELYRSNLAVDYDA